MRYAAVLPDVLMLGPSSLSDLSTTFQVLINRWTSHLASLAKEAVDLLRFLHYFCCRSIDIILRIANFPHMCHPFVPEFTKRLAHFIGFIYELQNAIANTWFPDEGRVFLILEIFQPQCMPIVV